MRSRRIREIVDRCELLPATSSRYQYPVEYEGGETPMQKLERLTWKGAALALPRRVFPTRSSARSGSEFDLIAHKEIAPYFLTVHEIVT